MPQELPQVILTEDQVERLLAAPDLGSPVGYRDRAMLEVFFGAGIRSAELLKLKVGDLDHVAQTITVRRGKGNRSRIIPVPEVTLAFCREYAEKIRPIFARNSKKKDDGTLFLSHTGHRLDATRLVEIFRRCRTSAGLDQHVTAMTLRHTVATHLLESGMDSRFIQEFLGHVKLSTVEVYTRITLKGLRKHYDRAHPMELAARRSRRCQGPSSDKT